MRSRLVPVAAIAITSIALLAGCSGGSGKPGAGEQVTLQFESWRPEDASVWTDTILPAFTEAHPDIKVEFAPTNATEFDAALESRFQGGTAGDVLTCRSYEINRANIKKGYLEPIEDLPGIDNFDALALDSWSSDDGKRYCVPAASVMAGFFYNKDIFKELGLKVPTTQDEFIAVLDKVKASKYTPLAYGAADSWILSYMGLDNVGPNYWHGEDGHQSLVDGSMKVTDPQFVDAFEALDTWKPYMPDGFASVTYADATQLFALGKAAIFPSGSWDINAVTANGLNVGVFGPPVAKAGDQRYLQDHPDMGIGINAASSHKKQAKVFLEWIASSEFQTLYANALPGFFGMGKAPVTLENPLAQEWVDLRDGAELTPRLGLDKLSGGNPDWETKVETTLVAMLTTDKMTPEQAAAEMQKSLESWYPPQKK